MRTVTKWISLVALVVLTGTAMGQTSPGPGNANKPTEEKKPSQLEELIAQALRDNPDVRVAEAKVREAEAELNRARLLAIQKVVGHQHTVETQTTAVRIAEARYVAAEANLRYAEAQYARTLELAKRGTVAKEDVDGARAKLEQAKADIETAKAALQAAKADLAKAHAELPYLLGKGTKDDKEETLRRMAIDYLGTRQVQADRERDRASLAAALAAMAKTQPQGTDADKLRKALDKQFNVKLENQPLADVLEWLTKQTNVNIVTTFPREIGAKTVTVNVLGISLGAAIQLLEDVGGVQFGVRDYGILVSDKLPSGVTRLHDFWKSPVEQPKSSSK